MVNPYLAWVKWVCIYATILLVITGVVLLIVSDIVANSFVVTVVIFIVFVLMLVLAALMLPIVVRNCHYYVQIDEKYVTLLRRTLYNGYVNYSHKKSFYTDDVYVTLIGPYHKLDKYEYSYKVYFSTRYLTPEDFGTKFVRKNCFYCVVNYSRLAYLLQYYKKPICVYLRKNLSKEIVVYKCLCHNHYLELLSALKEKNSSVSFVNFQSIAKRAIVAYSLCCLENALEFYKHSEEGWNVLLSYLWRFAQLEQTDTDGINNWFGLYDLLPNSFARPFEKYLRSHARFEKDIELERVSKKEYELIDCACNNAHSVVGELCEGILNLASATTSDVFYDISYDTLFTLQEYVLDVMERNQIPLPNLDSFLQYKHELPQDDEHTYCWGETFEASKFSKMLRSNQPRRLQGQDAVIKLVPALKNYIWGGSKLNKQWNKHADFPVAESWELSLNDNGLSVIGSGQNLGKTLKEVASVADFGVSYEKYVEFPMLIKLIDAASDLSVQVHPSDEFAKKYEGEPYGKTEVWYILDADEGAAIYLGLRKKCSREQLQQAISNGTVLNLLNRIEVKRGQSYVVPSGTLHAIGKGVTLYEIQQNSTLTYRAYDYGRVDSDGKTRELHVDKVLDCADLAAYRLPQQKDNELIYSCEYFALYHYSGAQNLNYSYTCCTITVIEGSITVNDLQLLQGETAFVSAGEKLTISGSGQYLLACK